MFRVAYGAGTFMGLYKIGFSTAKKWLETKFSKLNLVKVSHAKVKGISFSVYGLCLRV
jgi:hypothetical protein